MEEKELKEETYRVGKQILNQDDVRRVIKVKDEVFRIKFPTPIEQERIERDIALRLGGNPLDSIPASSYNAIRMCVTLDHIIEDSPEWWKTSGECYDEEILAKLWDEYLIERDKFRRLLRESKFKRNS